MSYAVNIMPSSGNLICWLRSHFHSSFNFLIIIIVIIVSAVRIDQTAHLKRTCCFRAATPAPVPANYSNFKRIGILHFDFFISVHSFDAHWTGPNPCLKLSTHSSPGCFERFHRWCFLAIMLQFSLCHSNNIRNVWNLRVFELILERHFDISQSIIR